MALWIIIYIASLAAFLGAVGWLLPYLLFRNRYSGGDSGDRGVRKYKIKDVGYAIVYKPEQKIRQHIKKYILYEKNGKKYMSYQLADDIKYIDFDITLFNKKKAAFLSLSSRNIIEGDVEDIELPIETAYVSLTVNRVNGEKFTDRRRIKARIFNYILYPVLTIIITLFYATVTKICCANIAAGVFREDFINSIGETILSLLIAFIIAIIMSIFSCVSIARNNKKN